MGFEATCRDFLRGEYDRFCRADATTVDDRFHRGVTLLCLHIDWMAGHSADYANTLLAAPTADLEYCWRTRPNKITGAVLLDAYSNTFIDSDKALPFTESYLRFVDPDVAYPAFARARADNFAHAPAALTGIAPDRLWVVTGTLGQRWALLERRNQRNHHKADPETQTLERWWRALRKQLPDSPK